MSKQIELEDIAPNPCAYCGKRIFKGPCRCKYRFGRMGAAATQHTSTARNNTVAQLREEVLRVLDCHDPSEKIAWCFSVTYLDDAKIEKADSKRNAAFALDQKSKEAQ